MLSDDQIAQALHAGRVVSLPAVNPHGPLGLEQLAQLITRSIRADGAPAEQVRRAIALPVETWEKLDQLARAASAVNASPVTASTLAAALLEQAVTGK